MSIIVIFKIFAILETEGRATCSAVELGFYVCLGPIMAELATLAAGDDLGQMGGNRAYRRRPSLDRPRWEKVLPQREAFHKTMPLFVLGSSGAWVIGVPGLSSTHWM